MPLVLKNGNFAFVSRNFLALIHQILVEGDSRNWLFAANRPLDSLPSTSQFQGFFVFGPVW
jgi:hypothetical protein